MSRDPGLSADDLDLIELNEAFAAQSIPPEHQAECLHGAKHKQIYLAETARKAGQRFRDWAREWGSIAPNAVHCIKQVPRPKNL